MAVEAVNYLGETLEDTAKVLAAAVLAVATAEVPVQVAPLNDDLLAQFGVWLRGEAIDLELATTELEKQLVKAKVAFVATPYQVTGERG